MYKEMGQAFAKLDNWTVYMITSHPDFERLYGKLATKKRKLFNRFIRTDYYQYIAYSNDLKIHIKKKFHLFLELLFV